MNISKVNPVAFTGKFITDPSNYKNILTGELLQNATTLNSFVGTRLPHDATVRVNFSNKDGKTSVRRQTSANDINVTVYSRIQNGAGFNETYSAKEFALSLPEIENALFNMYA